MTEYERYIWTPHTQDAPLSATRKGLFIQTYRGTWTKASVDSEAGQEMLRLAARVAELEADLEKSQAHLLSGISEAKAATEEWQAAEARVFELEESQQWYVDQHENDGRMVAELEGKLVAERQLGADQELWNHEGEVRGYALAEDDIREWIKRREGRGRGAIEYGEAMVEVADRGCEACWKDMRSALLELIDVVRAFLADAPDCHETRRQPGLNGDIAGPGSDPTTI